MLFAQDIGKVTVAFQDAKNIFGENIPYVLEYRLSGPTIIFNIHFITTVREAFTTGCMAKMDAEEEALFMEFTEYQSERVGRDITLRNDVVLEALDVWLANLVHCIPNPIINDCYDNEQHVWKGCSSSGTDTGL